MSMFQRVKAWRERVGLYNSPKPHDRPYADHRIWQAWDCFLEEVDELMNTQEGDMAAEAKELADVIVTVLGYACARGYPMDEVFAAVMDANDLKTGEKDGNGKVVKGPHYKPPDIAAILEAHRA